MSERPDSPPVSEPAVYLVRHCQSTGQAPDAPLTDLGHEQARRLTEVLAGHGIRRIVSSPYVRARQSIEPLAKRLGLPVETDERLVERVLAADSLPDWQDRIRASFDDLELSLPGGESTAGAARRARLALDGVLREGPLPAVVVAHGNLLAALLNHLDSRPGFETWSGLSNPDLFRVVAPEPSGSTGGWAIERLWTE